MSFVGDLVGDITSGITGAKQAGKAARAAGETQAAAAEMGVQEQRRQFDKLVELMAPYVSASPESLAAQQALVGLGEPGAEQAAISGIEQSPIFQALAKQGEAGMLQNASATGGLRGGNMQAALAQYRPQLLQQMIEQRYNQLGGITSLGQASAAGQASQGMQSASNISNLLANRGAAIAGGTMAMGNVPRQAFSDAANIASMVIGGMGGGGGGIGGGMKKSQPIF
jgi:hypothetical protein